MTRPDLGEFLNRTEPHLRTVQTVSDRYRKPRITAHEAVSLAVMGLLVVAIAWGIPTIIAGASLSYQMGDSL